MRATDGRTQNGLQCFYFDRIPQEGIDLHLCNNFSARYFFSLVNQTLRVSLRTAGAGKFRQLGKLPWVVKAEGRTRRLGVSRYPVVGPVF